MLSPRQGLWAVIGLTCAHTVHGQSETAPPPPESLRYTVEWRLIKAGKAHLNRSSVDTGFQTNLHLESAGLVSKLYKVKNDYSANLDANLCATSSFLTALEGRRQRETRITFDAASKKAAYLERDLLKNAVVNSHEIDIPACTHEIVGALYRLRALRLEPGQSAQIPLSDGKKSVAARVDAQQKDTIKVPAGSFQTIRHEAFLFNNVLYKRSGRILVWLTDDARRLPVQIQVRLQFHIGTITLQLEKLD